MTTAGSFTVRFGVPEDLDVLRRFEREYFPSVDGQEHAGYLFDDQRLATVSLTESIAAPERAFILVAETTEGIVGFAAAVPSRLPGLGSIDTTGMLLQHVAVEDEWRRRGVATALVDEIERRSLAARQNVIVAHVPDSAAGFYRDRGWEVFAPRRGFAWIPYKEHIRADVPDPNIGFPLMAAKVLRPGMIQHTFDFPIRIGAPIADAVAELHNLIDTGQIDRTKLNRETREFLDLPRPPAPRPGASFGLR